MTSKTQGELKDGAKCKVIGGTHAGKAGIVTDIKIGKTGYVSITVVQSNGERFKTLAKNVIIQLSSPSPAPEHSSYVGSKSESRKAG